MKRALLFAVIAASAAAFAQDAGDGLPDASVGEGGADRNQQEADDTTGRVTEACTTSKDCSKGFACADGRCVWQGVRRAESEGGCFLGAQAALVLFAAAIVLKGLGSRRLG